LRGPANTSLGQSVYFLDLKSNLTKNTDFTITCSEHGILPNHDNSTEGRITLKPISSLTQVIIVDWTEVTTSAYIRVYETMNPSNKAEITGIKIAVNTDEEPSLVIKSESNVQTKNIDFNVELQHHPDLKIQNINWNGEDLIVRSGQGKDKATLCFKESGNKVIYATVTVSDGWATRIFERQTTIYVVPSELIGPNILCNDDIETVSCGTLPSGCSNINWISGENKVEIISGQGSNSIQIKTNFGAIGQEVVRVSYNLNNKEYKHQWLIMVGRPILSRILGGTEGGIGIGSYTAEPYNYPIEVYSWRVTPSYGREIIECGGPYCNVLFLEPGEFGVECHVKSPECSSYSDMKYLMVNVISNLYIISYNNNKINLMKNKMNSNSINKKNNQIRYVLYNIQNGTLVDRGIINDEKESIDVSKIPKGVYVINLHIDEKNIQMEKILIE
jgi:hypothetical protein